MGERWRRREPCVAAPPPQPTVSNATVCDKIIDLMVIEIGPGVLSDSEPDAHGLTA